MNNTALRSVWVGDVPANFEEPQVISELEIFEAEYFQLHPDDGSHLHRERVSMLDRATLDRVTSRERERNKRQRLSEPAECAIQ